MRPIRIERGSSNVVGFDCSGVENNARGRARFPATSFPINNNIIRARFYGALSAERIEKRYVFI